MKKNVSIILSLLIFFSTFSVFGTANAFEKSNDEMEYNVLNENDFVQTEGLIETRSKDGSGAFELGFIISNGLFNTKTYAWHKGTFDFSAMSIVHHYNKHGKEVGADSAADYLNKALEYRRTVKKGVKPSKVNGEVHGVQRWRKNGKYIDLGPGDIIISYGKN